MKTQTFLLNDLTMKDIETNIKQLTELWKIKVVCICEANESGALIARFVPEKSF
jgi:hypothetical protein